MPPHFRGALPRLPVQAARDHYPPQEVSADDEFGIAPHTDTSFLTLLAPNPCRACRSARRAASGSTLPRFPARMSSTAGRCCNAGPTIFSRHAAPRRQPRGGERYALAFSATATSTGGRRRADTVGPDKPPKYPTTWYTDYMALYQKRTYDLLNDARAAD